MKTIIKALVRYFVDILPDGVCQRLMPLFSKVIDIDEIEERVLNNYVDKLICDKERMLSRIIAGGKVMYIKNMVWDGSYFNIAILDNLLGLVVYSLYLGYIPVIRINENNAKAFSWDWYFKQPLLDHLALNRVKEYRILEKKRVGFSCGWINKQTGLDYERWHFIYKTFVELNEQTQEYIDSENEQLGDLTDTLGVLMRGTDYVSLKPKGHPIQPELDEVINKTHTILDEYSFKRIYLATEVEAYFNSIASEFGKDSVLSNKRVYYDGKYTPGDLIGRIHFDRENDNYYKGLEYLSSMSLLSRCKGLIAGNCGGTKFAMLNSNDPFIPCYVFEKGRY